MYENDHFYIYMLIFEVTPLEVLLSILFFNIFVNVIFTYYTYSILLFMYFI